MMQAALELYAKAEKLAPRWEVPSVEAFYRKHATILDRLMRGQPSEEEERRFRYRSCDQQNIWTCCLICADDHADGVCFQARDGGDEAQGKAEEKTSEGEGTEYTYSANCYWLIVFGA
jgi:hypothetical protein